MNITRLLVFASVSFGWALSSQAIVRDIIFAEGYFANSQRLLTSSAQVDVWTNGLAIPNLDSRAIAISAGGNVNDPSSAPSAGSGTSKILLTHSAFGQMVAGPLGYPDAGADLVATSVRSRIAASPYKYDLVGGKPSGLAGGAYKILFAGMPRHDGTNSVAPGHALINFFPERALAAEYASRAALRISPFDLSAGRQLLLALLDTAAPLAYAGNTALLNAERTRLGIGAAQGASELSDLADAISRFEECADIIRASSSNPYDAALLEGLNPIIGASLNTETTDLINAFLRAVSSRAGALLQWNLARYQSAFRDPTRGALPNTSLAAEIENLAAGVRGDLLVASQFTFLPSLDTSELSRGSQRLNDLRRLVDSIRRSRAIFVATKSQIGTDDPFQRYAEIATDYVPIFQASSLGSSFKQAYDLAKDRVDHCRELEQDAWAAITRVNENDYQNSVDQDTLRRGFEGELVELCGVAFNDSTGNQVPDVFAAAVSPDEWRQVITNVLTDKFPIPSNRTGLIFQQWNLVSQAQRELEIAQTDLTNILSEMAKRKEIGEKIIGGQRRIANLILENGQKIVALDKEAGEVEAQLAIAIAEIQAKNAKKQAKNAIVGGVTSVVGGAIAAYFTAGGSTAGWAGAAGSGISGAGSTYTAVQNANASASAATASGHAQADAARRLSEIQAQKDRIIALERAEIQFEGASETELRLAEALHLLMLQAERQRLAILLAMQKLDQEDARLATLLSRVSYLMAEFRRAVLLRDQNPSIAPDVRLVRDDRINKFNNAFTHAQYWCSVAALAFKHRDHRPPEQTQDFPALALKCRNGSDLVAFLKALNSEDGVLRETYIKSKATMIPRFSIRHDYFQNNVRTNRSDTSPEYSYEPTIAGPGQQNSDAEWLQFLRRHLETDPNQIRTLAIPFSVGLERSLHNGIQRNPFFDTSLFGLWIFAGEDLAGTRYKGLRMNFRVKEPVAFQGGNNAVIRVNLAQEGTSFVRRSGAECDIAGVGGLHSFNGDFNGRVDGSINNIDASNPIDAFQERSPSNSKWVLRISSLNNPPNNRLLLDNLDKIQDIEIEFTLRGFVDQNCRF